MARPDARWRAQACARARDRRAGRESHDQHVEEGGGEQAAEDNYAHGRLDLVARGAAGDHQRNPREAGARSRHENGRQAPHRSLHHRIRKDSPSFSIRCSKWLAMRIPLREAMPSTAQWESADSTYGNETWSHHSARLQAGAYRTRRCLPWRSDNGRLNGETEKTVCPTEAQRSLHREADQA